MSLPIIDFHCDLLGCVEHDEKKLNFESREINCSLPQLLEGNVCLQVFAVAAVTVKGSSLKGLRQYELYKKLLEQYPNQLASFRKLDFSKQKLYGIFAIENASVLIEEDEPLDLLFERLEMLHKQEDILYLSLTWNQENRFGGGNESKVGLKEDGKHVLRFLSEKNIAIDFSHTSDQLAFEILDFIHKEALKLTPIASHSNSRSIKDCNRNLPDSLIKEVSSLGGVFGLNFVRRFVGDDPYDFIRHIEHFISLGAGNNLCFGADFYGGLEVPRELIPGLSFPTFQKDFPNSSCYPEFLELLKKHLSADLVEGIANRNAWNYLVRQGLIESKNTLLLK